MILVDRDIRDLVVKNNLIGNFNEDRLSSISYDVIIDKFILDDIECDDKEYFLKSGSYIYIKTCESLNMLDNMCCMVIEKNSLMRLGLKVDGPLYQPGHKTNVFLRVMNISNKDIVLNREMEIAQLIFLKLSGIPNRTYDKQVDSRYNNEINFRN